MFDDNFCRSDLAQEIHLDVLRLIKKIETLSDQIEGETNGTISKSVIGKTANLETLFNNKKSSQLELVDLFYWQAILNLRWAMVTYMETATKNWTSI